jgi:hypothetical protein
LHRRVADFGSAGERGVRPTALVSAFALWGIVQIAPSMPDAAVLNDVVIVLFVIDLAIIVTPWI